MSSGKDTVIQLQLCLALGIPYLGLFKIQVYLKPNSGYQWKSVIYWSSQWVQSNSWNTRSPFFLYQSLVTKDQGWFHPLHTCQHGLRQRKPLPGIGVHLQGCISQECPVVFCKESYRHSWAIPTRILSKFMNPWKYCGWKKSCAAG